MPSKDHLHPSATRYIPSGCLVVSSNASDVLPQQVWSLPRFPKCHHFGNPCIDGDDAGDALPLSAKVKTALLSSTLLSPYAPLVRLEWIRMALMVSLNSPARAIIRVFVLPDDVKNRSVPRSDEALRSARLKLMSQLDFSSTTWNWNGEARINPGSGLASTSTGDSSPASENGPSLLELFNSIPAPDPALQTIFDFDYNDAVSSILDSKVPGLNTVLFPHQRRSVAVMLQREAETRRVLDPRLVEHLDHQAAPSSWYSDPLVGTILREPRYYDSPRGGILAENMGTGKTLICLALCLATKHIPGRIPEEYWTDEPLAVARVPSLADIAAVCITRNGVSWKQTFESNGPTGPYYRQCVEAIRRNPACYLIQPSSSRSTTSSRLTRSSSSRSADRTAPSKIYLTYASLVIVPPNLVSQWQHEMAKHTSGLKILVCAKTPFDMPPAEQLLDHDIILFSSTAFEKLHKRRRQRPDGSVILNSPLSELHFKRCIVDEGHRLGSSRTSNNKINLQFILDLLHFTSRWIVTGTPSKGLFGVDAGDSRSASNNLKDETDDDLMDYQGAPTANRHYAQSSPELEKEDLQRIGSIATYYLAVRPWANTYSEAGGDTPALWKDYVMQPSHQKGGMGRPEFLKATLDSLIIRHPQSEIRDLLPTVNQKVVYLDPCYQDTLALNIFSAMIIFNAVQSQRTDQDYLFHPGPRQRRALALLVSNLRQASFFGGSFWSPSEIRTAVETAETFLEDDRVDISAEDDALLREAMSVTRLALENGLKERAYTFHEVPVYVKNFPLGAGPFWTIDQNESDPVCMNTCVIAPLQNFVQECRKTDGRAPGSSLCDLPTALALEGAKTRWLELQRAEDELQKAEDEKHKTRDSRPVSRRAAATTRHNSSTTCPDSDFTIAEDDDHIIQPALDVPLPPFAQTQMVSTASAKLSYLVDQIVRHHHEEQILVFYDHHNNNAAHYLAGMLSILNIEHLIYSNEISVAERARYVTVFNRSSKFRVLLMDISQAAFGLDMQSASRIFFINPVLNPQVEKQAIGRSKRIGQIRTVTVETLVLRGSMEELIVKRRAEMTELEQRKCHRDIIDDKPIYEWIRNAKILPLPGTTPSGPDQMAKLSVPQLLFGRRPGRESYHADRDFEEFTAEEEGFTHDDEGPAPFQEARVAILKEQFLSGTEGLAGLELAEGLDGLGLEDAMVDVEAVTRLEAVARYLGSAPSPRRTFTDYDSGGEYSEKSPPKRVRFVGV